MSENTQNLSGRELAKARRRALTEGKAKVAQTSTQSVSSPAPVEPVKASRPVSTEPRRVQTASAPIVSSGREAARARREKQVRGAGTSQKSQAMRHPRSKPTPQPLETVTQEQSNAPKVEAPAPTPKAKSAKVKARVNTAGISEPKGRLMSKAYRKAQSQGKTKLNAQKSSGSSMANLARVNNPEASGRDIAKQVRQQRCTQGKTQCTPRPTRSTSNKSRAESPSKVGFAQTGYEQTVSGTLVGESKKMTGQEAGQCRTISGTEYTGPDEFQAKCSYTPKPSPRKVQQTQTASGRPVSGSEVGRSKKVSGDMAGQCAAITGTEYLPADQSELFCGTKAKPSTSKVSQSQSKRQQTITGPAMEKGSRMTGLESGESANVTGNQYVAQSGAFSRGPSRESRDGLMSAPTKVAESETSNGGLVTGTNVGLDRPITGDDAGFCKRVSGMDYQGRESVRSRCQTEPEPKPKKVVNSTSFSGQNVTGDRAGLGGNITGAEPGRCKSVTGTPYMSWDSAEACGVEAKKLKPDTVKRMAQNAKPISGMQPSPLGLTGGQKGVCGPLTGSPYQGADQTAAMCQTSAAAMQGESDFPQLMVAQPMPKPNLGSSLTGAFSGGQDWVTGVDQTAWAPRQTQVEVEAVTPGRITGEGADDGFSITGDAWGRGDRVTGTEGAWAQGRNVSMKGSTTQVVNARDFRPVSAPPVPDSPITGSSGNTNVGSKVTVSGGARA